MSDSELLYHVTHTKHIPRIQKHGLLPMQTSNWVKAGDKERYGKGEVYTFTHKADAHQWAGRMDWAHHQKLGSGNISIVTMRKPKGHKFSVDKNDPLSQAGQKGKWLKTKGAIAPHHIVSVEPYAPKKMGEDMHYKSAYPTLAQSKTHWSKPTDPFAKLKKFKDFHHLSQSAKDKLAASRELAIMGNSHQKIAEGKDKLGVPTKSAADIAKKHGVSVDAIEAQIEKGVRVEFEHTKDRRLAHEIARDHLEEFPDYYDRLHSMEKKAKQDMKEAAKKVMKGFKMMKNDPPVPAPKNPLPTPKGWERVKDPWGFNVLRKIKEDAVPNSVGGGNIAGMPTHSTPDQTPVRKKSKVLRRGKFAGKVVFTVDEDTYYRAYLGKRKYEHYEKFLEGCEGFEEIRDFGRTYWDQPILIQNEKTGAMQFLKYGSR